MKNYQNKYFKAQGMIYFAPFLFHSQAFDFFGVLWLRDFGVGGNGYMEVLGLWVIISGVEFSFWVMYITLISPIKAVSNETMCFRKNVEKSRTKPLH